ncbi:MAG: lipid-A-disaccharide synthase [Bacteroidota bacterium]|jgi:lipid-A-disaccharide synthase
MKYFLVAGEASGDLHGSNLMAAIKRQDLEAEFRFFGGDLMNKQGGTLLKHYRELAFMGFIPVLFNLKRILCNLKMCQEAIVSYQPDVVVLIDYPGFNLKIAKYLKRHTNIPVCYYISPKVWAWKEGRVKSFKKYVDQMLCILPFEVDFFKKHNYPVHYVGNPTVDAVFDYKKEKEADTLVLFREDNRLNDKPIIALLAGSRKQEIRNNLPAMLEAASAFPQCQIVIAGAPGIDSVYYQEYLRGANCSIIFDQTYRLLTYAQAALVTSGTATLETALFRVPQVVCYKVVMPCLASWAFKHILHTQYISLVNLIADRLVVKELFARFFSVDNIQQELDKLLNDAVYRYNMLAGYDQVIEVLGMAGASDRAAEALVGNSLIK